MSQPDDLIELLRRAGAGERDALDRVFPVVYEELRRIAHCHISREASGHTLSTTALVHEAYLQLVNRTRANWQDRTHFVAIAATAMRRILVDHARQHRAAKRGGDQVHVPLDFVDPPQPGQSELLIALDDALDTLAKLDARQARVVECRFFGGLTEEETAMALGIGLRTAKRDWARAKSWLYCEIYSPQST